MKIEKIFVRESYKLVGLYINDIMYIESMQDYVKIVCFSKDSYVTVHSTTKDIHESVSKISSNFVRIGRSTIININFISKVDRSTVIMEKLIDNKWTEIRLGVGAFYNDGKNNYKEDLEKALTIL